MESLQDTFSKVANAMTHEIVVLRQRDRWWREQWKVREQFFRTREIQWLQAQSEWINWKTTADQKQQDSETREKILLKVLQDERKHLIVETEKKVYETPSQKTEQFWEQACKTRDQQWSQVLCETQQRWDQWKSMYDQLLQDYETSKQESKEREEVLLNLLQSEKQHLIIEVEKTTAETEASQTTEEDKLDQPSVSLKSGDKHVLITFGNVPSKLQFLKDPSVAVVEMPSERRTSKIRKRKMTAANHLKSGDDHVSVTFGTVPTELPLLKDTSVAVIEMPPEARTSKMIKNKMRKIKTTNQVVEADAFQEREKWFAEKLEEREKAWEKQLSESKLDHQSMFKIWKSLYDRKIQDFEMAANESKKREELFVKMLQNQTTHEMRKMNKGQEGNGKRHLW